jgi:hypothetical protein
MSLNTPPQIDTESAHQRLLLRFWHEAREHRIFHSQRGFNGNIEMMIAALKMEWIKDILIEMKEIS